MAQLNVDPSKVEELIRKFGVFVDETTNKEKQLKSFITSLERDWNDNQYQAVLQQFQDFDKKINTAMQEASMVIIPNLKNIKNLAENYKNNGRR